MKLSIYGNFVEDDNSFAYQELEGGYSKLIVTLINKVKIMVDKLNICSAEMMTKPVKDINEYLKFNVDGFDDFDFEYQSINIPNSDVKVPVYTFKPIDENNPYILYVVGNPGEIHYRLKDNIKLNDSINKKQGLLSFSMKNGEALYFMKNYISELNYYDEIIHVFIREQYVPGKNIIADIYNADYMAKYLGENDNKEASSAFNYPDFCSNSFRELRIYVSEITPHKYDIEVRDCDGRPEEEYFVEDSSLYSAYYNFMVEKGYFVNKGEKQKVI